MLQLLYQSEGKLTTIHQGRRAVSSLLRLTIFNDGEETRITVSQHFPLGDRGGGVMTMLPHAREENKGRSTRFHRL